MRITLLCLTLLLTCLSLAELLSQKNLRFGEWESHLPYQRGLSITQSPNKIYFGTDFSIMSIDKEDTSLEFISKVEGLSTIGIREIKYDESTGFIVVAYSNNEIDIITPEGVINFADIRKNLGIIGDKRINDIHFDGNKTAYFSLGFGLVSFDLENLEFGFTTQMGLTVNSATSDEKGNLYAATEEGIYVLDLNQNFNFGDFANWTFLGDEVGLPLIYEALDVDWFAGQLWLITDNTVLTMAGEVFEEVLLPENGEEFRFLSTEGPELMIGSRFESQFQSKMHFIDAELEISEGVQGCSNFITNAVMEDSGKIWYSDEWRGFRFTNEKNGECFKVENRSPLSHASSELVVSDGKLFVASGGVSEGFTPGASRDGIYILEDGRWTNYNEANTPSIKTEEFVNIFEIAKHPDNNKLFLGSFFSGLMEADFENNDFTIYKSDNSPVIGAPSFPIQEKVAGLAFDQQKTLWISCHDAEKPLVALSAEGNFHSFNIKASPRVGHITVDDSGNKWVQIVGSAGGVLVYDDKATVTNPSIHEERFISESNSNLPSSVVNCITVDLDGTVWVGTGAGPVSFAGDPFQKDDDEFINSGNIKIVLEDSIPARLLQTEDIRAIEVDGGNQKWFGSRNGIFVQSPDGGEKVARFTIENSPLFSNNIIDLEFDSESGLMYIASDGGIQSYKTKTTGGGRIHRANVYAYPNPVRPDYEGLIAFRGLARDATIKITDVTGQLVHESNALGGQATWDGRDYSGRDVASGVYLVFSNGQEITDANPDTAVTKVLIIR